MPLTFKLVGFMIDRKSYEIKNSYKGDINLNAIYNLFIGLELTLEEVQQIKFIIDSEQIKDLTKIYNINSDEDHSIYLFVFDTVIRQKLQEIFKNHGTINKEIDEPITQEIPIIIPEQIPILTLDIITKMNEKTLLLFSDPDFIILLSIYKRKPELFNLLSNYIQDNDINIESLLPIKSIDELTSEELSYYTELSLKIINLGFNISQEIIIEKLIKYSGHINLTIREIFN